MSPQKKYTRDILIAMALYLFVLFGVNLYAPQLNLPLYAMVPVALLPMVPVVLVLRAVLVFSRSWDELQRKKAMEATLIAFFLVAFGTFAYGFLEGIGLPKLEIIWVLPMMIGTQGLAQLYVARKY